MDFIKQIQRKHDEYMYQAQPHGLGSIREENYNSQNYQEDNFHG